MSSPTMHRRLQRSREMANEPHCSLWLTAILGSCRTCRLRPCRENASAMSSRIDGTLLVGGHGPDGEALWSRDGVECTAWREVTLPPAA